LVPPPSVDDLSDTEYAHFQPLLMHANPGIEQVVSPLSTLQMLQPSLNCAHSGLARIRSFKLADVATGLADNVKKIAIAILPILRILLPSPSSPPEPSLGKAFQNRHRCGAPAKIAIYLPSCL
jgi:hypothetical protein